MKTTLKHFILLFLVLLSQLSFGQKNFNLQEVLYGEYYLRPETLFNPQWKSDQIFTAYSVKDATLMVYDKAKAYTPQPLISTTELQSILDKTTNNTKVKVNLANHTWKDENTLVAYAYSDQGILYFNYSLDKKNITNVINYGSKDEDYFLSSDNQLMAWLKDNNIFINDINGNSIQVTNEPLESHIVNGSSKTSRNEFGINRGMWWNPKKNQLLYYRKDESKVGDYPLIDFSTREAEVKMIKYPMAGMSSEEVSLVVYDVATKSKINLQIDGPRDQYLTMVTWDPSGEYIYVGVLNRDQNVLQMNKYSSSTGKLVKTFFEEKSDTYIDPTLPIYFNPKNPSTFAYVSENEGYRQIFLYNTESKQIKNLGYQDVVLTDMHGYDSDGKYIYYTGTANKALERKLYRVNIKSGKTEILTRDAGTHRVALSPSKNSILDQFTNVSTPNIISVISSTTNKKTVIKNAENPLEGKFIMPKMELLTITAADGKTPLNARIIYPTSFDPSKKYPVMVYVYGGPHAQLVKNQWLGGASLFDYYMAQNGYIVFTVDNRGSYNRSKAFEHVIHKQLGKYEVQDQLKGIEYLKSKSYVNEDKIGIFGWSFGGFITTTLMVDHPEIFKVGVAGGPVIDWKYYEIMYGERYMSTPEKNPEGYKNNSLLNKADRLQNRLLIIHGAQDNVVVQQHSMEFIEKCIKALKPVDYFLYPTHEHNVIGKDRQHLYGKVSDYFFTHLAPSSQSNSGEGK